MPICFSPTNRRTKLRHAGCLPGSWRRHRSPEELVDSLPLFMRRRSLADLLSMDELYRMVLGVPGVLMEFGVHRGRHWQSRPR